jgi:transcriptional regulator with XRE-family HTH domain
MTIGQKIAVLREQKGWTQYRLAKECKTAPITVSRIESGKMQPSFEMVQRLSQAFGVSLSEFDLVT